MSWVTLLWTSIFHEMMSYEEPIDGHQSLRSGGKKINIEIKTWASFGHEQFCALQWDEKVKQNWMIQWWMIIVSWSFDLDRRLSWTLANLNAANSGVSAGQELLNCLCECIGSGWGGASFLYSSLHGTVFGFVAISVDNTSVFWVLVNSACTGSRFSLNRLGVDKKLVEDVARTADLNLSKGCSLW